MTAHWAPVTPHSADPVEDALGRLICRQCDGVVRTWSDRRFPIHAEPRPTMVLVVSNDDAPAGAGDEVEAYRG